MWVGYPVLRSNALHGVQDGPGEFLGGGVAAHVTGACLALLDDPVDGLGDAVGVVIETEVSQKHGSREDQSAGVGLVLALDVETDVTASGLEDGDVAAHVAARDNTRATDETSADVGENTSVQVGHDEDVELLGSRDALHGGVVDDHVVVLDGGEVLGDLLASVAEETVGELHDVGLVDAGDLLAVVGEGEGKGELGDALRLGTGDDLERLDDAVDRLVLQARVFTLGVLTDDAQVDVLVAGVVAGDVLDQDDGGVDVELLAEGDVERLVAGALDGGVEDTLETQLVALERGNGLAEELLGVLVASLDTGHVDLLPLDGHVVGLEDLLDRLGHFGTNTVTCGLFNMDGIGEGGCLSQWLHTRDQGDGVLAAELGGLEDVAVDSGHGWTWVSTAMLRWGLWGCAYCGWPWTGQRCIARQDARPAGASGLRVSCGAHRWRQWGRQGRGRTCAVFWEDRDSIVAVGVQSSRGREGLEVKASWSYPAKKQARHLAL